MSKSRWTPERRAKAAQAIHLWKPWEQSTGPRTDAGKTTAAMNALVHGMDTAQQRDLMKRVRALLRKQRHEVK